MKSLLVFLISVVLYANVQSQVLNPEEMKADLWIFRKALEAKHPEMYRYTSPEEFSDLFEKTQDSFNSPMSLREFYVTMSPLVAALRCGHTKWLVPGKDMYYPFFGENLFPLALYFHDEKVFVTGSYTGEEVPVGGELISLNGKDLNQIRTGLLNNLSFGDGYSVEGKYYQLNNFFPGIYSTYFGTSPEYNVEIKAAGNTKRYHFKGAGLEEINLYRKDDSLEKEPFKFELIDNNIAWLDIDRFYTYPGEPDFQKFLRKSFSEIESKGVRDLIIDLRGNEGGNENWGIELYRYLAREPFRYYDRITVKKKQESDIDFRVPFLFRAGSIFNRDRDSLTEFTVSRGLRTNKPFKNSFQGMMYLLLDGQSFSVATEFAARAKSDARCIVVGTETSGGYSLNSSGFFTIVNLPNSKIDLGIPLLGFHTAALNENNPKDRGVLPDHTVRLSFENFIQGNDQVREYTLNLIRKSGHQ